LRLGPPPSGILLREMPPAERPRERLLRLGPEALSDAELVAILLRSGTPGRSALDVAAGHLAREGGLSGMARRDAGYLARLSGIGPVKSISLTAALELGRRAARNSASEKPMLGQPGRVASYLSARAAEWPQERVGALMLDMRHRLVFDREIVRGSLDSAAVVPRDVLRQVMLDDAAAFILYHNHPSGDPTPSRDDVDFTRALVAASRQLGLRLLDHVIVGREGCVSLSERGLLE